MVLCNGIHIYNIVIKHDLLNLIEYVSEKLGGKYFKII